MVELILVCTGDKFDEWYVENLLHMIEKNGKLKYDKCHIIRDGEGNVYDKLQMFRDFTDDVNYLYFDLDVVIKGDVNHLVRDDFTLLFAWWRDRLHTPLNSSIIISIISLDCCFPKSLNPGSESSSQDFSASPCLIKYI